MAFLSLMSNPKYMILPCYLGKQVVISFCVGDYTQRQRLDKKKKKVVKLMRVHDVVIENSKLSLEEAWIDYVEVLAPYSSGDTLRVVASLSAADGKMIVTTQRVLSKYVSHPIQLCTQGWSRCISFHKELTPV